MPTTKPTPRRAKKVAPDAAPAAPLPLRLEYRSPAELVENPRNWRIHPEAQVTALTDVIAEVGWAGACLYNERTGRLIDGHARRKVAIEQGAESIPVLIGSWDEATEAKILATLDPIGALAGVDGTKLDALLNNIQTGSAAVQSLLANLKPVEVVDFDTPPESVQKNIEELEEIKSQRKRANEGTAEKNDTEKYLILVYPSRAEKEAALDRLGLPSDERYVPAGAVELRARGIVRPAVASDGRPIKAATADKSGAGG